MPLLPLLPLLGSLSLSLSPSLSLRYWKPRNHKSMASLRGWTEPTKVVHKTFAQWLKAARDADADKLRHTDEHLYLMLGTSPLKTVNQRKAVEPVRKGSRGAVAAAAAAQSLRELPGRVARIASHRPPLAHPPTPLLLRQGTDRSTPTRTRG